MRDYNVSELWFQIEDDGQMPTLFMISVRDSISMRAADMDELKEEDIIKTEKLSIAHEVIMCLPEGYYIMLGERGALFSDGQNQPFCIAGISVKIKRILFLHKNTSDRHIKEAL